MLLVAQRVLGKTDGVNVSVYVHPARASAILARDPSVAFDHAVMTELGLAPSLALTVHAVNEPGAHVASFLDVAFPDAVPAATVAGLIEQAVLRMPSAERAASWTNGVLGVRFHADPPLDRALEIKHLKSTLLPVLGHAVTRPRNEAPIAIRPAKPVRILRDRAAHGWRFTMDPVDRQTLTTLLGALPASFSIAEETHDAFLQFALAPLEQVVVEALTTVRADQIEAYGGATIIDRATNEVVWPAATTGR